MKNKQRTLITINELQMFLERNLLKKNLNLDDIVYMKNCAQQLVKLTDGSAKAYVFLGKVEMLNHEYQEAQIAFNQARDQQPNLASSYNGLFKINILQKQYIEALQNIICYQKFSNIDCSVYIALIRKIVYGDEILMNNGAMFLGIPLTYQPLLNNYNLFINYYNINEYGKALKHLSVCIKLIKRQGYHLDLSYVYLLLERVYDDYCEELRQKEIIKLKKELNNSHNLGYNYGLLINLINLEPENVDNFVFLIDILLVFKNYEQAEIYLHQCISKNGLNSRLKKAMEIINEYYCDEAIILKNTQLDVNINKVLESNNRLEAINLCRQYYKLTNDSFFLYRLGVLFYEESMFEPAAKCFLGYINSHKLRYKKDTYYYLFYIFYILKDDRFQYFAKKIGELSKFFNVDNTLNDLLNILLDIDKFDDSCIPEIEKRLFLGDSGVTSKQLSPEKMPKNLKVKVVTMN